MRPPVLPQRKLFLDRILKLESRRFNEAAGFTQRKPAWDAGFAVPTDASMRPPVLPSGNDYTC